MLHLARLAARRLGSAFASVFTPPLRPLLAFAGIVVSAALAAPAFAAAPVNDSFASATVVTATNARLTSSNNTVEATKEPGEPNHANNVGGHSVWWRWTAPITAAVSLDTTESSFDTTLAVYTGAAVNSLTVVASHDDMSQSVLTSALAFQATAGTTYFIAVDGFTNGQGSAVGNVVLKFDAAVFSVFTLAGSAGQAGSTDALGDNARFGNPLGLAIDSSGNLHVTDLFNNIRRVDPTGLVSTVAGLYGMQGVGSGSADGTGTDARFNSPQGIAVDSAGNRFVADFGNNTIRKITPAGVVTTFAGTAGQSGGTDAIGTAARFNGPSGLAIDATGNLYVADFTNNTIRKITPAGVVTTIAGTAGQSGTNNGTGAAARFNGPVGVTVDAAGNVFVAEFTSHTIRKIAPGAVVTTFAGTAGASGTVDGLGANARFNQPYYLTADSAGNLFVPDWGNHSIRKITPVGVVTTVAGLGGTSGSASGTGTAARFNGPQGIAVDAGGNLYVADAINRTVRRAAPLVTPLAIVAQPVASTVAAGGNATFSVSAPGNNYSWQSSFDGGVRWFTLPASTTYLGTSSPQLTIVATAHAMNGRLFRVVVFNDLGGSVSSEPALLTVNPAYQVQTLAGTAGAGAEVDATGAAARFNAPYSLAVEKFGNVYVADYGGHTIRKVTPAGVVTTLAGTAGASGTANGTGSAASFNSPAGITVDAAGDTVFVADTFNDAIRKITPLGVVTTFAGTAGATGNTDATGAAARFNKPSGLVMDASGNSYVADYANQTIRKITSTGVVTTLAGTAGAIGSADGTGAAARFNNPNCVAVSPVDGTLYVADGSNHTIRKITPAGVVTTLAGTAGVSGGADGMGSAARFNGPSAIIVDATGTVFVADGFGHTIRRITPAGVVTTIAGSAATSGSANGVGSAARFNFPFGIAIDAAGVVLVADSFNHTIRRLVPLLATLPIATQPLDTEVAAGYAATFTVVAPGLTYQWQRSTDGGATWSDAPENATFSGTMTPRLTIAGTTTTMSGDQFRVAIGNGLATSVTSAARTLTVGPAYTVSTLAGTTGSPGNTDGTGAAASFTSAQGLGMDATGNVYVSSGNRIRKVTAGGVVTTLAGSSTNGSADGTGAAASFQTPSGTAADAAGNVFVADYNNHTIRKITPAGVVTTFAGAAGAFGSTDATGTSARFRGPADIAIDAAGTLYVADQGNHTVRKITPAGVVSTLAGGTGLSGSADGTGSDARFKDLNGLTVDSSGNVYVSDFSNQTIRKITPAGVVTTLAGTALIRGPVDGTGAAARFDGPNSIGVDAAGNSFVTDYFNHTIRKITPSGQVSTVIGLAGVSGSAEGTGVSARLNQPGGVVIDAAGNLTIADTSNFTIRKAVPVYGPAAIKSALAVTGTATTAFSYAIVANGAPQSYSTTTLPAGLTLDPATGIISGTTTLTGAFAVSVTAQTAAGPTTAFVVLTFNAPAAPVIGTQPIDATVFAGTPAQFAVTATGATALTYKWQVQAAGDSTWTDAVNGATYSGATTQTLGVNATLALNGASYQVIVTDTYGTSTTSFAKLLTVNASVAPLITTQPAGQSVIAGGSATFTAAASGTPAPTFQWKKNGVAIPGATSATYIVAAAFSGDAGLYTLEATGAGTAVSDPAILGITTTGKLLGAGTEVGSNIVHPSGNIYDQILLTGTAVTFTADPGQVTRMSYIDLSDDIVQVEFSGAGSLTLVLDNSSGPATPVNYNQPGVSYMKGHAGIVLAGANDTTNVTVFSVGRINAVNQALFKDTVTYDGLADIAFFAIRSADGKFAGARMANTSAFATRGTTGFYAPAVQFSGPVFMSDISAADTAMPVFILGSGADTRITGGDLLQANAQPVKVSGLTQLRFVTGSTSHGVMLPGQIIKGRLHQNGVDVTDQIAVAPVP